MGLYFGCSENMGIGMSHSTFNTIRVFMSFMYDEEFGRLYNNLKTRKGKEAEEIIDKIINLNIDRNVSNFFFAPYIDGKIDKKGVKILYQCIKDKEIIKESPNCAGVIFPQIKSIFKYCSENNKGINWF